MNREVLIEILVYLIIIVSCLVLTILAYYIFFQKELLCVGNLNAGKCSDIKPYFCLDGNLVKNVIQCGCSVNTQIKDGDCISTYETVPRTLSLPYTLRGIEGTVNFVVYEGVYNYIINVPRYIASNKNPTLLDFRLKNVDEPMQREFLFPLVFAIQNITSDREDQARIAVSLVQNIPYGVSDKSASFSKSLGVDYQRYAYEVIYENEGVCGEKSALLIYLLRELGYGTAFLYYPSENHEAVGIKCPAKNSVLGTDYCFIETTAPSIISDDKTEFTGIEALSPNPTVIVTSDGNPFGKNKYEYNDAVTLEKIRESMREYGAINFIQSMQFRNIKKKYGFLDYNEYEFN